MRRLAALLGCLAVACGAATVQAQTLKLAYSAGDTRTFSVHVVTKETIDISGITEPLDVDMTVTETQTVNSVDPSGVADVTLTLSGATGTVSAAGQTSNVSPTLAPIEMKIAPDGRTLSMNGVIFAGGSPLSSVGSNGPESAVFPDGAVKPGDSWTKTYERSDPLAGGTVTVVAKSKYLRDEKVNGTQTAVVNTKSTMPLDRTIDLTKYGQAMGASSNVLTSLGITGISIHGTDTADTTTWIDPRGHTIRKTSANLVIDGSLTFLLAPGAKYPGPPGPFMIKGDETIDVIAR